VKRFIALILFFLSTSVLLSQENAAKKISIHGLRIYDPSFLSEKLSLPSYLDKDDAFGMINSAITSFYRLNGYTLASCYLVSDTDRELSIYVDEGNLGRIIFKGLDDITLIRAKFTFSLEKRIYHEPTIALELDNLKKKYDIGSFDVEILPVPDYDKGFIQLGDILKLPFLPAGAGFPFFERYGYRFDLVCTAHYNPHTGSSDGNRGGYAFSASLFYLGIKPKIKYNYPGLIMIDDRASTYLTCGISYFSNSSLSSPPSLGFVENGISYRFPTLAGFFTPGLESITYFSSGARTDIGIDSYRYIYNRTMIDPSFSLKTILTVYPGFGVERYRLFSASFAQSSSRREAEEETKLYLVGNLRTEIERFIVFLQPAYKRSTTLNIYFYKKDNSSFKKTVLASNNTFSGFKSDVFIFSAAGTYMTGKVPFYHDEAVNGGEFKGFSGKGYFSKKIIKAEIEYKTSLHRGYMFFGPFLDGTVFSALDEKIPETSKGICGGIAGHLIFFDQFEFSVYFGRDYLFGKKESAYNLLFNIAKNY
jgi:hypothetical protein